MAQKETHALVRARVVDPVASDRWRKTRGFTATPASATRITVTSTASLQAGQPIRYQTVAGGSTYYYALISAVSSNAYIDIKGPSLSGATLSALWIGDAELVVVLHAPIYGLYAVTAQDILGTIGKEKFSWQHGPAACVKVQARSGTLGAGTAKVNLKIAGNAVDSSGIVPTTSFVESAAINSANYSVVYGNAIEISVATTDATAKDLSLCAVFVLA